MSAHERLDLIVDADSFEDYDANLYSIDSLEFPEYPEKLERDVAKTGLRSEMLSGIAKIGGYPTAIAIGDVGFIGGTCGSVIGEKVSRCIERALKKKIAVSDCFRERWNADAGRDTRFDANGENCRCLC